MTPEGLIFLIGGEHKEKGARNNVYYNDIKTIHKDRTLKEKSPLLKEKYDFTLCYTSGYIYLFCGKDKNGEILNCCEKYNL